MPVLMTCQEHETVWEQDDISGCVSCTGQTCNIHGEPFSAEDGGCSSCREEWHPSKRRRRGRDDEDGPQYCETHDELFSLEDDEYCPSCQEEWHDDEEAADNEWRELDPAVFEDHRLAVVTTQKLYPFGDDEDGGDFSDEVEAA